jgi:ATPase subunit of ABC transporter with duplicated ATPase domains
MELQSSRRGGDAVVGLEGALIERNGFVLGPVDLELGVGDRLAVRGPNGAGKSTLLEGLLGQATLRAGRRWCGPSTVFATLPQLDGPFATEAPLIEVFREHAPGGEQESRATLATFGLGAEDVRRPSRSLSPGERTRAGLALIVARGANTLVLDEPTNNLDIEAIEQLESALGAFAGTVVLVSHDRRFLESFPATRALTLGPSGAVESR